MSTQETAVHKLRVSVVQAEKLMAKDRGGTSDPFVAVRLGSVTHTTKVVAKTLAPHWNETWIFDLCTPSGGGGRGADGALEEEEVMEGKHESKLQPITGSILLRLYLVEANEGEAVIIAPAP